MQKKKTFRFDSLNELENNLQKTVLSFDDQNRNY